jgi:hypothetical protein
MAAVWARGPDDIHEVLVLLALADQCNGEGILLAQDDDHLVHCGRMCSRTVVRVLKRLEEAGWLTREVGVVEPKLKKNSTEARCNRYTLNVDKLLPSDAQILEKLAKSNTKRR